MNYSTYRFTLDIHKTKSQVSIPVLFQDTGTQFYINLTDGGKPYHIEDGCKATLYGKKPKLNPDGKYDCLLEECEIIDDGTRIRYEFSDQTTTQLGSVACEIRLYSADGKLLTTPAFEILVEARVIEDDEIIESADERTALDRIFESEAKREEAELQRKKDFDELVSGDNLAKKINLSEKDDAQTSETLIAFYRRFLQELNDGTLAEKLKIPDVIDTIPLVVDEVLIVNGTSDAIDKEGDTSDYENWLDTASFSRRPKVGEVFWCIVKSKDNYLYTALAKVTGKEQLRPNGMLMYPFKLVEAIEIYNPMLMTKYIPLLVDEVLDLPTYKDNILDEVNPYTNSIDAISLNKVPKTGERFWCISKSLEGYLFSTVAEITDDKPIIKNEKEFYEFKFTEAYIIYDPTESLHLSSDTEQVVDSDVKFKKDVTIEGDLNVLGEYTKSDVESLVVKDRFIVCNDGKSTLSSGIIIRKGNVLEDGMVNAYNAYGIILDPDTEVVRLGRGYVSNEKPHLGYAPSFTFGYVEQDAQGRLVYTKEQGQAISTRADSGDIKDGNLVKWDAEQNKMVDAGVSPDDIGGVSIEDIVQVNTKTGNLVQWDATQKKLVDTGFKPAVGASANSVVVRNENGTIFANGGVGSRKALMNVEGVQKALSFRSVDSFTANTNGYIYNDGQFRAKGWVSDDTYSGDIINLPADNDWAQRIVNSTDSDKLLRLRGALKHGDNVYYDDRVFFCTDKATLNSQNTKYGDLAIVIKAHASIYINSIYTENSAMRIYIT